MDTRNTMETTATKSFNGTGWRGFADVSTHSRSCHHLVGPRSGLQSNVIQVDTGVVKQLQAVWSTTQPLQPVYVVGPFSWRQQGFGKKMGPCRPSRHPTKCLCGPIQEPWVGDCSTNLAESHTNLAESLWEVNAPAWAAAAREMKLVGQSCGQGLEEGSVQPPVCCCGTRTCCLWAALCCFSTCGPFPRQDCRQWPTIVAKIVDIRSEDRCWADLLSHRPCSNVFFFFWPTDG